MSDSLATQVEEFLTYLRDVRRLSPHTLSNYARDLQGLTSYCEEQQLGQAQQIHSAKAATPWSWAQQALK